MICKRDFCYNQDYEWYETRVLVDREWVNLFAPRYLGLDLPLLPQRFSRIVSWVAKNRTLVDSLCVRKLSAHLIMHGENLCWEKRELTWLSLSLEKENAFELLLACRTYQKYVLLLFDKQYELLDCKIDF